MTATTIRVQMAQRKDTAANWTAANPILLSGEIGYETDTKKFKIGNGSTNWNSLAYLPIPDGSGNLTITGNLEIGSTGSLTFEGSTADGFETTLAVTNPTADRTITLPDRSGTVITSGDTGTVTSTMLADGTIVNADISATAEIAVSKLANGSANQIITTDGTDVSWSSNLNLAGNATIQGDLTVNGTTTTIDSQTLLVEDKNIEMGVVATPTDVTADGGGITLRGTTNKTINWIDSTDSWTSSEHVDLASGKSYRINNTEVLSSTTLGSGVTGSSLTSVGTIGTGVWQGTAISATYLDATLVKTSDTGTVTSTMIANGTIVDADINASAAIADTKLATISTAGKVSNSATTATSANTASAIVARDASGNFTAGTITANLTGTASAIADSSVTDAKVSATAAIAGTKISPDFGSQNVTTTGTNTAASFIPTSSTVPTSGLYLPSAGSVAISTNSTQRLLIDASGNVNIDSNTLYVDAVNNRVGIGTNTPNATLTLSSASSTVALSLMDAAYNVYPAVFSANNATGEIKLGGVNTAGTYYLTLYTQNTERARIDASGRLLVGTSTTGSVLNKTIELHNAGSGLGQPAYQVYSYPGTAASDNGYFLFYRSRGSSVGTNTIVANGDRLGLIRWHGADGSSYTAAADIYAEVDGTPGTNDMPGRLVFSTTADGASSPTERMRITSVGDCRFGTTNSNPVTNNVSGVIIGADASGSLVGYVGVSRMGGPPMGINRGTDDGNLIEFCQAGTQEGTISVSGTTVSYNGAHLSRWSQLSSGVERTEILRGSVLSNIDEMCEWGNEDNEQLNRMKVSDVEGDKNVSGVFQAWDDDDDTYTNDFYCAMTGDFIIRIGAGVTVERGDLLMSAGDGTAKPQDDDIIRSKTVAKVTSTNVSCTYGDGSYCVPCVLMAC